MSAYDTWEAILTKLTDDLATLQDGGQPVFSEVRVGRKESPEAYPSVLIWPEPIPQSPTTATRSEYRFVFRIIAVVEIGESYRNAMKEGLQKIVEVNDYLIADRSFAANCDRLEVNTWTPDVFDPRVTERHQAALTVTFYKII